MCGRYFLATEADERIQALIDDMNLREKPRGKAVKTGEIFPGDEALVVATSRAGNERPFLMRWGFRGDQRLIINARSETAAKKPMFCDLLRERRALIPASGYFEWQNNGKQRVKYALTAGQGTMFMAGLYRVVEDRAEFVVLTRAAATCIAFIHGRMPVILGGEAARAWQKPDCDPARIMALAEEDVHFCRAEPQEKNEQLALNL